MSVYAVIVSEAGIALAADGCSYDDDYVVHGIASKIETFPEHDAALCCRGPSTMGVALRHWIQERISQGFDEILAFLPEAFRETLQTERRRTATAVEADVLVAGWSRKAERYQAYVIFSQPELPLVEGGPPAFRDAYQLHRLPASFGLTTLSPENQATFGVTLPPGPPADLAANLDRCVLLIDAARMMPMKVDLSAAEGELPCRYGVGGFVEAVTIERGRIVSTIPVRWKDKVGSRIDRAQDRRPMFMRRALAGQAPSLSPSVQI